MNNLFDIMRIILIILFAGYQFWAFKNKKPLRCKLMPVILMAAFALLMLVFASFAGFAVLYFMLIVVIIEALVIGSILLVITEICSALLSENRNYKKAVGLLVVLVFFVLVYYLGQRVF